MDNIMSNSTSTTRIINYGSAPEIGTRSNGLSESEGDSLLSNSSTTPKLRTSAGATIGKLGSVAICVNSLTGPAMLHLPITFARSGLIPTIGTLLFVCFLSSFCSLHLANAIRTQNVPLHDVHGHDLPSSSSTSSSTTSVRPMEYAQVFGIYWGPASYWMAQILFLVCVTCLNLSSIVDTAQTIDTILGHAFLGELGSVALWFNVGKRHFYNGNNAWLQWVVWSASTHCTDEQQTDGTCLPFAYLHGHGLLLTAGYLLVAVCFIPLALVDLKENASWQIAGFIVLLITSVQFVGAFWIQYQGLLLSENNEQYETLPAVSWWGSNYEDLLGVILFNFALAIAVPAWLYEVQPQVNVSAVVHGSSILSCALYIAVGGCGYLAMPVQASDNMLPSILAGSMGTVTQWSAFIFCLFIIGLGIPLFSVLTRSAVLEMDGVTSRHVANVASVWFPFGIGWTLYQGRAVTALLSWGGVFCTSLVVFVLPLLLALHVLEELDDPQQRPAVSVYFGWNPSTKRGQQWVLRGLLALSIASVVTAIVCQFLVEEEEEDDEFLMMSSLEGDE